MKRILITGANSYIGTSFENYLRKWPEEYTVDVVDMHGDGWRQKDFGSYDTIFHVAGIAHSDIRKASDELKRLYYAVNTDLAIDAGEKAKHDGAKQFVFISSMVVYGSSSPVGKMKVITSETIPAPLNFYGDSKLKAEEGLQRLADDHFKVVVLRPPMVYGKGCKGNYPVLSSIARKLPVCPYIQNARSMIYVENLMEFVRLIIQNEERGFFYPQNREFVRTCDLMKTIAATHDKEMHFIKGFNWVVKLMGKYTPRLNKAFGSLTYEQKLSVYRVDYIVADFEESIRKTEA